MIIKITVNDNDFTELLEEFSKNLVMKLITYYLQESKSTLSLPLEEQLEKNREAFDNYNKLNNLLNPNTDLKLKKNSEDYNFIKETIQKTFFHYLVQEKISVSTKEYLYENFQIEILYEMKDKWENGEVVYYFTTQNVFITQ